MSAFGYFGSKLRIAAKLHDQLPPHNAWVELFCGSAAMTIAKEAAPIEIINDINKDIFNFYKQLRERGDELVEKIELTPYAREELHEARILNGSLSDLERARRFFVSAMMAVNGSFGRVRGGFSVSNSYARRGMEARVNRWNRVPENLLSVIERLKGVRIENQDALVLFEEFKNRPATLVYFDPPYLGDRLSGYDHDERSKEYHERLLKAATKAKCMIFISGYSNDLYEDHLTPAAGWSRIIFKAMTKGSNGQSHRRKEIVWFNTAFKEAKRTGKVPITLRRKELKNGKLNPAR